MLYELYMDKLGIDPFAEFANDWYVDELLTDNLYSLIKNRSGLLESPIIDPGRNIVRIIANLILPVYFRCTQNDPV